MGLHRLLHGGSRLFLGGVLLAAGAWKATEPWDSVQHVHAFQVFSPAFALAVGVLLPGVEIVTGAAILVGFLPRGAALTAGVLAAGFVALNVAAIHGKYDVDCGCFGSVAVFPRVGVETVVVDLVLLAAAGYMLCRSRIR